MQNIAIVAAGSAKLHILLVFLMKLKLIFLIKIQKGRCTIKIVINAHL